MTTKQKPKNPYVRLVEDLQGLVRKILSPHRRQMFTFDVNALNHPWALAAIFQRTHAAQQLGYTVEVIADSNTLKFQYVQRPSESDIPYNVKYPNF